MGQRNTGPNECSTWRGVSYMRSTNKASDSFGGTGSFRYYVGARCTPALHPTHLVLAARAARRDQRIHFIEEKHRGGVVPRHREERCAGGAVYGWWRYGGDAVQGQATPHRTPTWTHAKSRTTHHTHHAPHTAHAHKIARPARTSREFLRLAVVLGHERRGRDVEETRLSERRDGASEESLASAGWAEEQHALPWLADASEKVCGRKGEQEVQFRSSGGGGQQTSTSRSAAPTACHEEHSVAWLPRPPGMRSGRTTASFRSFFALSSPPMESHSTRGICVWRTRDSREITRDSREIKLQDTHGRRGNRVRSPDNAGSVPLTAPGVWVSMATIEVGVKCCIRFHGHNARGFGSRAHYALEHLALDGGNQLRVARSERRA